MRFSPLPLACVLLACVLLSSQPIWAETVDDLLKEAQTAFGKGKTEQAIALAGKAIELDPTSTKAWLIRATFYREDRKPKKAIADYTKVLRLDPKSVEAYSGRGGEHFKLGRIKESIADFDKQIALKPADNASHWRRGISYYYAGRFDDGWKQFEDGKTVYKDDVENAVWHFLCLARSAGVKKAQKAMLKIGKDPRVPMMEIYAFYAGKAKPEDVLASAMKVDKDAKSEVRKEQLFYAHLYLGLYYEVTGNNKRAKEHMKKAAKDYAIGHYMGDVARVHLAQMGKEKKK
jgi:lipoprotein NlpI